MSAYVPIPLPYAGLISMFLVRAMVGYIGPKMNAVTVIRDWLRGA